MKEQPIIETFTFKLEGETGRLDKVLVDLLDDMSRTAVQNLIKDNHVKVNNKSTKANYKLEGHETIHVAIPAEEILQITPEDIPLEIVYEDDDLLVVNKPQGMVVHPSKGHYNGTLVNALMFYLQDNLSHAEESIRPGIVHRIDKDTSGLLLVAKNNKVHQHLSEQLTDRTLGRIYVALVNEPIEIPTGVIEVPLGRDPHNRLRFAATQGGKYALTSFKVLQNYTDTALVEAELKTGRTHQIRVHFEYIGHPIVGDPVYRQGVTQMKGPLSKLNEGQFLHAKEIHFVHPTTGESMSFNSPLPTHFQDVLATLNPLDRN